MYRVDFQVMQHAAVQHEDEQRENKHLLDFQQILLQELEKQQ